MLNLTKNSRLMFVNNIDENKELSCRKTSKSVEETSNLIKLPGILIFQRHELHFGGMSSMSLFRSH